MGCLWITKRIPVLDDRRHGLLSEKSMGLSLLDTENLHSEVQTLVFPGESKKIDLHLMKRLIQYPLIEDDQNALMAKAFFEHYLEELNKQGIDFFTIFINPRFCCIHLQAIYVNSCYIALQQNRKENAY